MFWSTFFFEIVESINFLFGFIGQTRLQQIMMMIQVCKKQQQKTLPINANGKGKQLTH